MMLTLFNHMATDICEHNLVNFCEHIFHCSKYLTLLFEV